MKFKLLLLAVSAFLAVLLSACNGNSSNTSSVSGTSYPGTLQGQIFDATTGAPIGGSDLQLFLVQGVSDRGPDKLHTGATDPLMGEYAFANIPVQDNGGNNNGVQNQFKLVVIKTGYQKFESEFQYSGNLTSTTTSSGLNYNMIGNVYLYPTGTVANPVVISVTDTNSRVVVGATVQLFQGIANNTGPTLSSNRLFPTNGLLPALTTAVTDAAGKATFAATVLALGASYTPVALAITANGQNLATTTGASIIVGSATANQGPQVRQLVMATSTYSALAIVAKSNQVGAAPLPSGVLNLVFNEPFTVDSNTAWTATVTVGTGPAVTATVTGVVTGSSMVLTPVFTPAIDPLTMVNVNITYTQVANSAQAYLTATGLNTTAALRTLVTGQTVNLVK